MRQWQGKGPGPQPFSLARAMAGGASSPPADPLAALYGVGMGQIPLHLAPEDAVLDGGGNVLTVPNRGGAGAAFGATSTGTGMTRANGRLQIPAEVWLTLANHADIVGTRFFFVAALPAGMANDAVRFLGNTAVNLARIRALAGEVLFQRNGVNLTLAGVSPGSALHLFEIEIISGGTSRLFVDGAQASSAATPATFTDFLVNRVFAGPSVPSFTGQAGDVLSVITDGTLARDPTMLTVRQTLAAKHGVALA